jgi:hypothetical protein
MISLSTSLTITHTLKHDQHFIILVLGRNTVRITKCHKLEMETIVLPLGYYYFDMG